MKIIQTKFKRFFPMLVSVFLLFFSLETIGDPETAAAITALGKQLIEEGFSVQKEALIKQFSSDFSNQNELLKKMMMSGEGHYKYGELGSQKSDWDDGPDNWDSTLNEMVGENKARYHELVEQYKKNHQDFLKQADFVKGASKERGEDYERRKKVNRSVSVQAVHAFNDIKKRRENLQTIASKIEEAPDLKAAIDLNSRLVTELAYISIQNLKMQALNTRQVAEQEASLLEAETRESIFSQSSENK